MVRAHQVSFLQHSCTERLRVSLQRWFLASYVVKLSAGAMAVQGQAPNNFKNTLPETQSDLAKQLLKDPYSFDFLTLTAQAKEKEIEAGLMTHLQKFLLELGSGFAFVGRQVPLKIASPSRIE